MPAENHLIARLPPKARKHFLSQCEHVPLSLSDTLHDAGSVARHVYFPIKGFVSLVALVDEASAIEVGMVGREGMLGVQVALNVATWPLRCVVQGEGNAWRMTTAKFRAELADTPALRLHMHRYMAVLMSQLATSAACVRFHQIGPRLARWLLMSQDRAEADRFKVTQEFLSYMLGVQRVGITKAAIALQRQGLIVYRRGELSVVDRVGLEAAACSCYASDRSTYRVLGLDGPAPGERMRPERSVEPARSR